MLEYRAEEQETIFFTMNPTTFCLKIETKVYQEDIKYIEAIAELCEEFEIPENTIGKFLTPTMIEKIEMEAEEWHNLKK